jgi:hypothetical protein
MLKLRLAAPSTPVRVCVCSPAIVACWRAAEAERIFSWRENDDRMSCSRPRKEPESPLLKSWLFRWMSEPSAVKDRDAALVAVFAIPEIVAPSAFSSRPIVSSTERMICTRCLPATFAALTCNSPWVRADWAVSLVSRFMIARRS